MLDIHAPGHPRVRRNPRSAAVALAAERWDLQKQVSAGNIEQWRQANPEAFKSWDTKYGHVAQIGSDRFYVGRCKSCPAIITCHRDVSDRKEGFTQVGRWPCVCSACHAKQDREHDDRARGRMQRLRGLQPQRAVARSTEMFLDADQLGFASYNSPLGVLGVGHLVGRSLGILCLDCLEPIRFRLDITWPRPIPGKTDTPG